MQKNPQAQVAYVTINGDALYPFCLLKRESLPVLKQQISENKLSLRECFKQLNAQSTSFQKQSLFCHSINSLDELQQYQQMKAFRQMFI